MSDPPTVFTVCGLPASGKTTLARRIALERRGVCFSADAWILELFGPDLDVTALASQRERVWRQIWAVACRLLELELDVVLDFSFYTREERERFRHLAHRAGARFRMIHLEAEPELLLERLRSRNRSLPPATFSISPEQFEALRASFEAPAADEAEMLHVRADVELAYGD